MGKRDDNSVLPNSIRKKSTRKREKRDVQKIVEEKEYIKKAREVRESKKQVDVTPYELTDKNKKSILKNICITFVLTIITELLLVFAFKKFSAVYIPRMIVTWGLYIFFGLHYSIGAKPLYRIIITNRYKISIVMIVLSTILGYFIYPTSVKELLMDETVFLGLIWNIKFYVMILATYELLKILTNEDIVLSVVFTIVIVLSSYVQFNFYRITPFILEEVLLVLSYNVLVKPKAKNLYSLLMLITTILFLYTCNSLALPFGLVFMALLVWIVIDNREQIIESRSYINYLITILLCIVLRLLLGLHGDKYVEYTTIVNKNGIVGMFSYLNNIILTFRGDIGSPAVYAGFISLFPIPLILALYYMFNKDDHMEFFIPIVLVCVFELVFGVRNFPIYIDNIIHFNGNVDYMVCIAAVGLCNLFMAIYFISHVENEVFKVQGGMRLIVIVAIIMALSGRFNDFAKTRYIYLYVLQMTVLGFTFLYWKQKKYRNTFLAFMIMVTLLSGPFVNPLLRDSKTVQKAEIEYEASIEY